MSAHFYFRVYIVSFRVFQDRITEEHAGRPKVEILFQQLKSVEFPPHNRRMGGFTLHSEVGKIYLGHGFSGTESVLDLVKQARPELVSISDYEQTRKQLASRGTFNRLWVFWFSSENFKYLAMTYGPVCAVSFYFFHRQMVEYSGRGDLQFWLGIVCVLILIQMLHIYIENRKHFSKISSLEAEKSALSEVPENVRKFTFIHVAAVIVLAIVYGISDLNMIQERTVYGSHLSLKLRNGQTTWEDSRIRCLECKYPLKKGNEVWVNDFPGVLIGLPGEVMTVNRKAKNIFIHEVFGGEQRIGDSEVGVQIYERGRPVNVVVPLWEIGGVLRRKEPLIFERNPLSAESVSFLLSTVIAEADFSQELKSCPAGVLQAANITAAKIAQDSDGLLKQKNFKEAQRFIFASGKSLTEILSQCPAAAQAVLIRFNTATKSQLDWDQITIAKDAVDKLRVQAETQFASLQRMGTPGIGQEADRVVSGAKVPPLSQTGATLAPTQPTGTLQPTQPTQIVQPTQIMERVQPPQPFQNPKPVQVSPIQAPFVPSSQAPSVPAAPAKNPVPDNIPPPPRAI